MATYRTFRERTEELEHASLSTWATLARQTKGRDRFEEPDPLRTAFQDDIDRILTTRAFRALSGKSARLPATPGRTRLTEVLEVTRLARLIARALRLNEDLVEAIAAGAALGAPPFGAAGTEALATFSSSPYRMGDQALRIVEHLERGGAGLNLTWEARDGLLHCGQMDAPAATAEGQAVAVAVRLVRVASPLRDAVGEGLLNREEVTELGQRLLGDDPRGWTMSLVHDAAAGSVDRPEVALGERGQAVVRALEKLRSIRLDDRLRARADHDRAVHCLRSVLVFALEHNEQPAALVVDELAALTDAAALARYRSLFEPNI